MDEAQEEGEMDEVDEVDGVRASADLASGDAFGPACKVFRNRHL
jgi:hypothetical protein